jgi:hypothetical protein
MWAGMGGSIEVLAYLKQHGVKLTRDAVAYAAQLQSSGSSAMFTLRRCTCK